MTYLGESVFRFDTEEVLDCVSGLIFCHVSSTVWISEANNIAEAVKRSE